MLAKRQEAKKTADVVEADLKARATEAALAGAGDGNATEEGVGLHACQKSSGVPENKLTQDVKTRWRSTHGMTDSLRVNQEPLLLYEVRKESFSPSW